MTGGRGNRKENTWKNREDDVRSGALVKFVEDCSSKILDIFALSFQTIAYFFLRRARLETRGFTLSSHVSKSKAK